MVKVAIVRAVRTAIGSFGGVLREFSADQLATVLIQNIVESTRIQPHTISEVILGQVYSSGCGMNPARIATIKSGLPNHVPATLVNQVCGSGLKSIIHATESIMLDDTKIILAGGMESMSSVPFMVNGPRWGNKLGHLEMRDLLLQDGLTDAFHNYHMGVTAENIARKYAISRADQDLFAYQSQQKYHRAQSQLAFQDEIVPVPLSNPKKHSKTKFDLDEHPRPSVTLDSLAQLNPVFEDGGSVTAGNSSGINDGASIVMMMSEATAKRLDLDVLAYVKAYANVGLDPQYMGLGPVYAIRQLMQKNDLDLSEIDLFELNEAFAAQSLAVISELSINPEKVNVHGGAIALGHPLAASGTRISTTLLHLMKRKELRYGLASLCVGGGMGIAILFECPEH